ncbi:hypothetical protein FB451DRAFT_1216624, partial [Mycena latifolia]
AAVDLRASSILSSAFDDADDTLEDTPEDGDEVFTHRSAYFSAGGAYDCFAGPDLGVEFASAPAPGVVVRERETRGRRGSSGAEILEIEGASPLRARSKSRSKSRSRSRTPSPAILPAASSPSTSRDAHVVEQQPERPRAESLEPHEPPREFKPRVRRRAHAGELARGAYPRAAPDPPPRPHPHPNPARPPA